MTPNVMEKAEASNEEHGKSQALPASSPKAHGEIRFVPVTQSPKKRRKVNHGISRRLPLALTQS